MNRIARLLITAVLLAAPTCSAQDWSQQVEAALNAAGNHNAIIDMTHLSGPQTSSVNPFAGLSGNANVVVKIGCYNITTTAPWVIAASHVRVEFCSADSQLSAAAGFPRAALITIGNNEFPIQDALVEGGYLNCNNVAGCTGFVGNSMNEFSGLRGTNIGNTAGASQAAVLINGTAQTNGHYIFEEVQIVNTGANDCIEIVANGVNQHRIHDITCNNSTSAPGKAGVHLSASGMSQTVAAIERVHVEGFADGVFFDNRALGSAKDVDCTSGCSDAVHIGASSCSDIFLSALTVTTAPNIIRNDCLGQNIPNIGGSLFRTLAMYTQSNYGGNPARASYWNGGQWMVE